MRAALRPMSLISPLRTPPMSDVMAMTAAMPITIPKMVRRLRPRFASSERSASRAKSRMLMRHPLRSASVADGDDAVRLGGDTCVVRDEDDGLALILEAMERLEHLVPGCRVEVARGLVGQDDGGVVDQRAGDGHSLHLTARELFRAMVVVVERQAHGAQGMDGAYLAFAARHIDVGEWQHDVVEDAHARQEVEALEHEADARRAHLGELIVGGLGDVEALEQVSARGRCVEASQDVHECGLVGA